MTPDEARQFLADPARNAQAYMLFTAALVLNPDSAVLLHAAQDAVTTAIEAARGPAEREVCEKCRRPFDPADTRWDGQARQDEMPFCRNCVSRCHDTEIADHWCPVDQWRQEQTRGRWQDTTSGAPKPVDPGGEYGLLVDGPGCSPAWASSPIVPPLPYSPPPR